MSGIRSWGSTRIAGTLAALASLILLVTPAQGAGPRVTLVVSPQAPGLERTAATELADLLQRMYQAG